MIVVYTSSHGFGHASRDIEVMNAIARRRPESRVVVRTAVPAWLYDVAARARPEIQRLDTDSGVAQVDSLTLNEDETARRALRFYDGFDERVAAEAAWLRDRGATAVVFDIPPLACAAAARAGIPAIALANFTWDWIYRGMQFERRAPSVLPVIEAAYATTTQALRLPLHGGFDPMAGVVRDIPFVARRSLHSRESARSALGVRGDRPVVLASFGGHGVRMPYEQVARDGRITLMLTDFEAASNAGLGELPHLQCFSIRDLAARGLHYEDLVAAADVVVSKPGYGIVSECIANGASLLYTSRGRMVEYDVFVAEMPGMLRCRFITQEALLAGDWQEAIEALLDQPQPAIRPMTNGADIAADCILETAQ